MPPIREEHVLGQASRMAERSLKAPTIHRQWISAYRNKENERFFALAFDYLARVLDAPEGSRILDAGCGTCAHSVRLAERGFIVEAVDVSESVVAMAEEAVKDRGLAGRITVRTANLRRLPFRDGAFPYVFCWGVLMHIPEVEQALAELARVLAPGGTLVLGENNLHSIQSIAIRSLRTLLGRNRGRVRRSASGSEEWSRTEAGMLMTRETDMRWLVREAGLSGLVLKERRAGQASDLYAWLSSPLLKRSVHLLNALWFKHVRSPHLAFGNILTFRKV